MPASASAGGAQIGLVLSGSKGCWQKNRRPGYSALRGHVGDQPDRRPPLLPMIFPHYRARTRARDGAPEHAELAPGSDDATKKLDAKGRPVDFKELLRSSGTTNVRNVSARIGGAGSIGRAAGSCRSRRSPDTIDGNKLPRPVHSQGELPCSRLREVSGPTGPACARPSKARSPPTSSRFLTCEPNAGVGCVPAKAKAVILTTTAVAR